MAIINKTQLKKWFSNLKKPTQEHFWAWLDSYFHKDEKIPKSSIEGWDEFVNSLPDNGSLRIYLLKDASNLTETEKQTFADAIKLIRKLPSEHEDAKKLLQADGTPLELLDDEGKIHEQRLRSKQKVSFYEKTTSFNLSEINTGFEQLLVINKIANEINITVDIPPFSTVCVKNDGEANITFLASQNRTIAQESGTLTLLPNQRAFIENYNNTDFITII